MSQFSRAKKTEEILHKRKKRQEVLASSLQLNRNIIEQLQDKKYYELKFTHKQDARRNISDNLNISENILVSRMKRMKSEFVKEYNANKRNVKKLKELRGQSATVKLTDVYNFSSEWQLYQDAFFFTKLNSPMGTNKLWMM